MYELNDEEKDRLDRLPRNTLKRVMTPEEATELVGTRVEGSPGEWLRKPGIWTDEDTGEPVLAIFKAEESAALRKAVLDAQGAITMSTTRVGTGNRNASATFGYRPRKPMMSQEGCVLTAFNRDFPSSAAFLSHYSEVLSSQLRHIFPEVAEQGQEMINKVYDDWRLSKSSLWTSGVINRLSQLPYHRDGNNFDAWSVMPVIRRNTVGGGLHIPEYGVTYAARDSTVAAFYGKRLVHGVTPMRKTSPDGYRISIVFYALQGLKDCHTFAEETAYARAKRAEREEAIAARPAGDLGTSTFKLSKTSRPGNDGRVGGAWLDRDTGQRTF